MLEPITTKRHFYKLWNEGLLGNKPRTWENIHEAEKERFPGMVALRYVGHGSGGPMITNLRVGQLSSAMNDLQKQGYKPEDFQVTEQFSPTITPYVINGEITRTHEGLALFFSIENNMMRPALASSGKQVFMMEAMLILKKYLPPLDVEDILGLSEMYPDHVIEFSGFNRPVGTISRRNAIIWEVRRY